MTTFNPTPPFSGERPSGPRLQGHARRPGGAGHEARVLRRDFADCRRQRPDPRGRGPPLVVRVAGLVAALEDRARIHPCQVIYNLGDRRGLEAPAGPGPPVSITVRPLAVADDPRPRGQRSSAGPYPRRSAMRTHLRGRWPRREHGPHGDPRIGLPGRHFRGRPDDVVERGGSSDVTNPGDNPPPDRRWKSNRANCGSTTRPFDQREEGTRIKLLMTSWNRGVASEGCRQMLKRLLSRRNRAIAFHLDRRQGFQVSADPTTIAAGSPEQPFDGSVRSGKALEVVRRYLSCRWRYGHSSRHVRIDRRSSTGRRSGQDRASR